MTKEEIIKHLHEALNSVDITFPYRYVFVEAIELLSRSSLPSKLDEAAEEYERNLGYYECVNQWPSVAFKAGAEWMAGQFVLVGGEPTGWFKADDGSEYATGLDLKGPIKLPVDFYVRKKDIVI